MTTLPTIIPTLEQGDWFLASISKMHIFASPYTNGHTDWFFRFILGTDHYQYKGTLWILYRPLSILQSLCGSDSLPMQRRHHDILILRWLSPQGSIQTWCSSCHMKGDGPFLESQPSNKHTKIDTVTGTIFGVYWDAPGCNTGQSLLSSSQIFYSTWAHIHHENQPADLQDVCLAVWSYGSGHVRGKACQVAHALSPGMATHSVCTSYSLHKLLSMPIKVKDSILWWTQPKNICVRSLSFNQHRPWY